MKLITDLKALGYSVSLEGDNIRLKYLGIGTQPVEAEGLIEGLRAHKGEAVEYLKARRPVPTLDAQGCIERIPFKSDPRFFYWQEGGQSISETEKEINRV